MPTYLKSFADIAEQNDSGAMKSSAIVKSYDSAAKSAWKNFKSMLWLW